MFKSKDEKYLKPSSSKSGSCILGMGSGFLSILLLSSLKSEMKQTFFLGIINVGAAYSKLFSCVKTPMLTNLLSSILRVSSYTFGIGKGLG